MRYLKSACGIPSCLCTAAGWQGSAMASAPWLRVAALLRAWWGRSRPARLAKVVSRQILCSVRSQLFSFEGPGKWLQPFIAPVPAVALWIAALSWYQHLPWMSQDQFRGERWKKDKMFRHWVLWVMHLGSLIMMTYSQKVFFSRSISLPPGRSCASCHAPQDSTMCLSPFDFHSFLPGDMLDTGLVLHPKVALWGSHHDSYFRLSVEAVKCCGFQAVWPFVGISAVPQVYLISLWLSASWLMRAASLPWLGCSVAKRELSSVKVASALRCVGFLLLTFPYFFFPPLCLSFHEYKAELNSEQ